MRPLTLSEVFGPTFQGEGPSAGRRAAFVRLGLCNLDCAWCDTPYTWDWTGRNGPPQDRSLLRQVDPSEVVEQVLAMRVPLVVITGGEPMIQQTALGPFVAELARHSVAVEIETNGTLLAREDELRAYVRWNVSPKLSGSGVDPARAIVDDVLADYDRMAARYKFVVSHSGELDEIEELTVRLGIVRSAVWVMPEGRSSFAVLDGARSLADAVLDRGWNLSMRLHTLLWEDERAR